MKNSRLKGTYAYIYLDHIIHNYKEACRIVSEDKEVSCVVKSDAYGHGENQVVQALIENGLKIICVSTIMEAIRLRKKFEDIEILILGYTPEFLMRKIVEHKLIQTISTLKEAEKLNSIGKIRVHIKINTGMNRLGFDWKNPLPIEQINKLENIKISGIFSHLHSSADADKKSVVEQFRRYNYLIDKLEYKQINFGIKHICNSGGIIDLQNMHLDMVREGIMLYGLYPSNDVNKKHVELKECMSLRSYIANILEVNEGEGISYDHTFIAKKTMKVATVNIGYSDGVFRNLSNKGEVIINDERRKIVGRVCMNMFVVDITGMKNVAVEDEVILFGESDTKFISIDEVAANADTISYEIVCRTGYSVPRVYIKNGKVIEIESEFILEE